MATARNSDGERVCSQCKPGVRVGEGLGVHEDVEVGLREDAAELQHGVAIAAARPVGDVRV